MPKEPIHTSRAPAAIGPYSQAIRAGNTIYLSGQIPLESRDDGARQRRHSRADAPGIRQSRGRRRGGRRLARERRAADRLSDGSRQLFRSSTRSWPSTARSRIRHARRSASRSCRAAPPSRSTAFSSCRRPGIAAQPKSLFDRPVESLTGVGPKVAERLAKLGVRTVGDLLCLLPQRYEDRTALRPIGSLAVGEKALVEGVVELSEVAIPSPPVAALPARRRHGRDHAAVLLLQSLAAASARARPARALLRRGAKRPGRPRDGSSRAPRRACRRNRAERSPDARLSDDRRPASASGAPHRRARARGTRARDARGLPRAGPRLAVAGRRAVAVARRCAALSAFAAARRRDRAAACRGGTRARAGSRSRSSSRNA